MLGVAGLAIVGLVAAGLALSRGMMPTRRCNAAVNLSRVYARLWHGAKCRGVDRLPATGPIILAANHTTGVDPFLLQAGCPRLIHWVMLQSWRFRLFEPVWQQIEPITLESDAGQVRHVRQIVRRLEKGDVVGLFPEGGLGWTERGLQPFQPGIAMIARRSEALIVPALIEGTPRRRSMLWHFLQPSRSRVTFGQPYRPDPAWSRQQILDDLRQRIEALAP